MNSAMVKTVRFLNYNLRELKMIIYDDLPVVYDTGEILEDTTDWTTLKMKSNAVSKVMIGHEKYWLARSERMLNCGSILRFAVDPTGKKRLIGATFCKDRLCPACQKRRSLAMFHQVKDVCISLKSEYKSTAYLLLTLTVPNVKESQLGDEITKMNTAWSTMTRRKQFKSAIWGFFKALEITHNAKTDTYHPHFHVLLAVPNKYFKGTHYITHANWLTMWQECMKNDYITQVDVRRIRPNPKRKDSTAIESAAAEVGKYATKPADYVKKTTDGDFIADGKLVK
jgi:plasmid rolling circle replication initiator protein Rep